METWLHWVWFLIPYYFKLFRLKCSSLQLLCLILRKKLPTIFRRMWLVRPRPHAKYTRTLYPYIPGIFNWSNLYSLTLLEIGIHQWPVLSWYHIIHILCGGYYNMNMVRKFSSSVRQPPTLLEVYDHHMAIIHIFL